MSHRPCTSHASGTHGIGSGLMAVFQTANLTQPAEPRFRVLIKDISLHHPPKVGVTHLDDHFYVKISLDGREQTTSPTSIHRMPWAKRMIFDGAHDSAILIMTVFARRKFHEDADLGTIRGNLASFMGLPSALHPLSDNHSRTPQIS
ncbi:hypothetical protein PAXINDRAFT_171302, partial [Paxillus involutus ATCC 200175]